MFSFNTPFYAQCTYIVAQSCIDLASERLKSLLKQKARFREAPRAERVGKRTSHLSRKFIFWFLRSIPLGQSRSLPQSFLSQPKKHFLTSAQHPFGTVPLTHEELHSTPQGALQFGSSGNSYCNSLQRTLFPSPLARNQFEQSYLGKDETISLINLRFI